MHVVTGGLFVCMWSLEVCLYACGHWRFVCVHVVTGGLFVCMWSLEVCLCACGHWRFVCVHVVTGGLFVCMWSLEVCLRVHVVTGGLFVCMWSLEVCLCACGHWRFVCVCMWSLEVCLCMQCIVQWRTSNHDQPVGEVLSNHYLQERSGGTTTSEEIPWRAMEDVFTFLTSDHESREYRPDSGSCSIQ